jgi:hypothetical protein
MMKDYAPEVFTRDGTRVHSPLSRRRTRRLARFAAISVLATLAGLALLAVGISGL